MSAKRENMRAGLFVLTGLVLASIIIFLLTDLSQVFQGSQTVKAYYQLSDGLSGLQEGAEVTIGDQPVGSVTAIDDVTAQTDEGQRIVGKVVTFTVPRRGVNIYWNAIIEIKAPPIGSGATLNLSSVGYGMPYEPDAKIPMKALESFDLTKEMRQSLIKRIPAGAIPGSLARNRFTRELVEDMGIGDTQRQQIRETIERVRNIVASVEKRREKIGHLVEKLDQTVTELSEEVPRIKRSLENIEQASADGRDILASTNKRKDKWFDDIDGITGRLNKLLADKDQSLRAIVDNVEAISVSVKDESLVEINKTLKAAREGAISFEEAGKRVSSLLAGQTPVIERALANLQLTADQLKMASIEIRRSPWRLLYSPTEEELETDNLYDAARSFAIAAGALQAASTSLNAYAQARPEDEAGIKAKIEHLEQLFKRFKETEDQFWRQLEAVESR